jgi:ubiquinone/menaquinone biosynthesis C-methylase UbiE
MLYLAKTEDANYYEYSSAVIRADSEQEALEVLMREEKFSDFPHKNIFTTKNTSIIPIWEHGKPEKILMYYDGI